VSISLLLLVGPYLLAAPPQTAQTAPPAKLPEATQRPLAIDFQSDPVLSLRRGQADRDGFRQLVEATVRRHPATLESLALEDVAGVRVDQERAGLLPTVDASVSSYRVIARDFSNDPDNIIERSRAAQRTDVTLAVQQTVFDFGASSRRIRAARDRERAAAADTEAAAERVALDTVSSWYEVFGMRALVRLGDSFVGSQRDLRRGVEQRIKEGASAEADLARVDSYIAGAERQLAGFRRALAGAEARFRELTGSDAPADLERAPTPAMRLLDRAAAAEAARNAPAVRSAEANAAAAEDDERAIRAQKLPNLSAGLDAGRYGVLENPRDYDVRARVTLRQRLFGGTDPRVAEFRARSRAADARFDRIREEAGRDAAIAWADVQALEQQLVALESAYVAGRRSRDVIAERFRVSRGDLIDVLAAQDAYFGSAAAFIQGLTELDAARYVLLARTGNLLREFQIDPDIQEGAK
jgi:adhesin transport system outer membrane protein